MYYEVYNQDGSSVLDCYGRELAITMPSVAEAYRRRGYIVKSVEFDPMA